MACSPADGMEMLPQRAIKREGRESRVDLGQATKVLGAQVGEDLEEHLGREVSEGSLSMNVSTGCV